MERRMGKAHRGRRFGEGETTIQREALPDFLSASDQANPSRQSRRGIECECGSSLFDQTPSHESIRRRSQGVGDETWVACRDKIREVCAQLVRATKSPFSPETDIGESSPCFLIG